LEKFFRIWKPEFAGTIYLIIPVLLQFCSSRKCPAAHLHSCAVPIAYEHPHSFLESSAVLFTGKRD